MTVHYIIKALHYLISSKYFLHILIRFNRMESKGEIQSLNYFANFGVLLLFLFLIFSFFLEFLETGVFVETSSGVGNQC